MVCSAYIDNRTCKSYCQSFPYPLKEVIVLLGNYKLIVLEEHEAEGKEKIREGDLFRLYGSGTGQGQTRWRKDTQGLRRKVGKDLFLGKGVLGHQGHRLCFLVLSGTHKEGHIHIQCNRELQLFRTDNAYPRIRPADRRGENCHGVNIILKVFLEFII